MRDYLTIACSPVEEDCAQINHDNYETESIKECNAFIAQLRRTFGNEPEKAKLAIKIFPHEFGSYREVVCYFDDDSPEAIDYAYKLEANTPANWDEKALLQLERFSKL